MLLDELSDSVRSWLMPWHIAPKVDRRKNLALQTTVEMLFIDRLLAILAAFCPHMPLGIEITDWFSPLWCEGWLLSKE